MPSKVHTRSMTLRIVLLGSIEKAEFLNSTTSQIRLSCCVNCNAVPLFFPLLYVDDGKTRFFPLFCVGLDGCVRLGVSSS